MENSSGDVQEPEEQQELIDLHASMEKARGDLQELYDRFPRLFHGRPTEGYSNIPSGWKSLVFRLCAEIDALLSDEEAEAFRVFQIKPKFAELRFYFLFSGPEHTAEDGGDQTEDKVDRLVEAAVNDSLQTCEVCGAGGATQLWKNNRWLTTLCPEHGAGLSTEQDTRGAPRARKRTDLGA